MNKPIRRAGRPSNAERAAKLAAQTTPHRPDARAEAMEEPATDGEGFGGIERAVAQADPALVATRPAPRAESPRERAARRAAELRDNREEGFDGTDKFYIDSSVIPDGWDYEWKAKFVANQEQLSQMMAYKRAGWEEVPTHRHPEMMAAGTTEPVIIRDGLVLMERPKEISDEARRRLARDAREQVSGKEREISGYEDDHAIGEGQRARVGSKISKSFEAMPIPD